MLNGKRHTEGCCPDPEHMGIHSEERVSKTQPCCQADPGDFDLLMNCFIDLHLPLLILRMPTTMSVSSTLFILHFMQRRGYYRMLLYVWLKSSGLSSVPPLLWRLFLSQANLYCGSLRQLSSAQWCKRTNLMPPPQSPPPHPLASLPHLRQATAHDQPPLNLFPSPSLALITMWRQ